MSKIKGKDTKPELLVRKFLFAHGLRYKLYDKSLPGKPDLVFPKYKTALFINGCFWHGHQKCRYFVLPKTRTDWWFAKIKGNQEKDIKSATCLSKDGWKIITVWECELKPDKREHTLHDLLNEFIKVK